MLPLFNLALFYVSIYDLVGGGNDLQSDDDIDTDSLLPDDSCPTNNPMMHYTTTEPSKPTNTTSILSYTTSNVRFASLSVTSNTNSETSESVLSSAVSGSPAPSDDSKTPLHLGMYVRYFIYYLYVLHWLIWEDHW